MKEQTLSEIVKRDFRAARVFEHFGLDYCCGGNKTIEEACSEKGINIYEVLTELRIEEKFDSLKNMMFKEWEPRDLINYIIEHHHSYVRNAVPRLEQILEQMAYKHESEHPELKDIRRLFLKLGEELTIHMMREETVLFPYILRISEAKEKNTKYKVPVIGSFQTVRIPIEATEREHTAAGSVINEMKVLSNDFTDPQDACIGIRRMYEELKEFETDLHIHIHLENNVLFPKAIEMEETLKKQL